MPEIKSSPPRRPFFGAASWRPPAKLEADVAIIGFPHGTPYSEIDNRVHEEAPDYIRGAVRDEPEWAGHWDFDYDGTLLADGSVRLADLGNLETSSADGKENRKRIEAATRAILQAGAVPLAIGGDDSVPIPFLAAYSEHGPITVFQIDAHIDWRDERYGEQYGFSSTMRRASEMRHVTAMVQVGMRGAGSARRAEVEDAKSWGAKHVTAREVHKTGVQAALGHIQPGSKCVIAVDCDALDPAIMPAVAAPTPGGLTYTQLIELVAGVAAKAQIAGFSLVEFVPGRDNGNLSGLTAARILSNVVGAIGRSVKR